MKQQSTDSTQKLNLLYYLLILIPSLLFRDSWTNMTMNVSGGRKHSMIVDLLLCDAQGCISFLVLRPPVLPTFLYILGDSYSMNLLAKFCKGVLTSDKCHVVLTACQAFSVAGIWPFFFVLCESRSNNPGFWIVGQDKTRNLTTSHQALWNCDGYFSIFNESINWSNNWLVKQQWKKCQSEP